jgi:hypothetical protein
MYFAHPSGMVMLYTQPGCSDSCISSQHGAETGSESACESATGCKQQHTKVALVLAPELNAILLLLQCNARVKLCFSGSEQGVRLHKRPALRQARCARISAFFAPDLILIMSLDSARHDCAASAYQLVAASAIPDLNITTDTRNHDDGWRP